VNTKGMSPFPPPPSSPSLYAKSRSGKSGGATIAQM